MKDNKKRISWGFSNITNYNKENEGSIQYSNQSNLQNQDKFIDFLDDQKDVNIKNEEQNNLYNKQNGIVNQFYSNDSKYKYSTPIIDEGNYSAQDKQKKQYKKISIMPNFTHHQFLEDIQEQEEPKSSERRQICANSINSSIQKPIPFNNIEFVNHKSLSKQRNTQIQESPQSFKKAIFNLSPAPPSVIRSLLLSVKKQGIEQTEPICQPPQLQNITHTNTDQILKSIQMKLDQINYIETREIDQDLYVIDEQLDRLIEMKQSLILDVNQCLENQEISTENNNQDSIKQLVQDNVNFEQIRSHIVGNLGFHINELELKKENQWSISIFYQNLKLLLVILIDIESKRKINRKLSNFNDKFQQFFQELYQLPSQIKDISLISYDFQIQSDQELDFEQILRFQLKNFHGKRATHSLLSSILNTFPISVNKLKHLLSQIKQSEQLFGILVKMDKSFINIYYGHRFLLNDTIDSLKQKQDTLAIQILRERNIFCIEIDIQSFKISRVMLQQKYQLGYLQQFDIKADSLDLSDDEPFDEQKQNHNSKQILEVLEKQSDQNIIDLLMNFQRKEFFVIT